jgi:hypothetical protein
MTRPFHTAAEPAEAPRYEDPAVADKFQSRARREGAEFDAIALDHLAASGAIVVKGQHHRHHYPVDAEILTPNGGRFLVLAHGNIGDSSRQPGLQRPDTLAKVAHRALMLAFAHEPPVIVVTSHLPKPDSTCAHQLADLHHQLGRSLADVVATTGDLGGFHRLQRLFSTETLPAVTKSAPWWNPGHDLTLFDVLDPGNSHA